MTEDQLEQEALGWLADVGYTHVRDRTNAAIREMQKSFDGCPAIRHHLHHQSGTPSRGHLAQPPRSQPVAGYPRDSTSARTLAAPQLQWHTSVFLPGRSSGETRLIASKS